MHKLFRLGEPILPHLLEKLARNRRAGGFADDRVDAAVGADSRIVQLAIPLSYLAGAKRFHAIEATAGLILCMIPIIIFYISCQRYIVKGVTDGAVKG